MRHTSHIRQKLKTNKNNSDDTKAAKTEENLKGKTSVIVRKTTYDMIWFSHNMTKWEREREELKTQRKLQEISKYHGR